MPVSIIEIISATFLFLWSVWPIMFLAALEGLAKRRRVTFSHFLRTLVVVWVFWAGMRLFLLVVRQPVKPWVPEPWFWLLGLVLGGAWVLFLRRDRAQARKQMRTAKSLQELLSLSPKAFEQLVAEAYRAFGNRVEVVAAQGDHGVDLVIYAPNGEKRIAQCKRWKTKVGEPVVRDFYGAMLHEGAVEGAIITTGAFTPQAVQWAKGKPIRLYDGEAFLKILEKARSQGKGPAAPAGRAGEKVEKAERDDRPPTPAPGSPPLCPKCGIPMRLRTASKGPRQGQDFWGCANYPQCRVILPVEGETAGT